MKTFKAICAASLLALSLSIPAFADDTDPGELHTPGKSAPAPGGAEIPATIPGDTGLTGETKVVVGDISIVALADIVWALASIF